MTINNKPVRDLKQMREDVSSYTSYIVKDANKNPLNISVGRLYEVITVFSKIAEETSDKLLSYTDGIVEGNSAEAMNAFLKERSNKVIEHRESGMSRRFIEKLRKVDERAATLVYNKKRYLAIHSQLSLLNKLTMQGRGYEQKELSFHFRIKNLDPALWSEFFYCLEPRPGKKLIEFTINKGLLYCYGEYTQSAPIRYGVAEYSDKVLLRAIRKSALSLEKSDYHFLIENSDMLDGSTTAYGDPVTTLRTVPNVLWKTINSIMAYTLYELRTDTSIRFIASMGGYMLLEVDEDRDLVELRSKISEALVSILPNSWAIPDIAVNYRTSQCHVK